MTVGQTRAARRKIIQDKRYKKRIPEAIVKGVKQKVGKK